MKILSSLTSDDKNNLFLIFLSAILFFFNEHIKFQITLPYLGYILRNHYNDFIGGLAFMSIINIILLFSKYKKIKDFKTIIILSLACGGFWELISPLYIESTGDFFDIISYTLGFSLYWLIKRFKNKNISYTLNKLKSKVSV